MNQETNIRKLDSRECIRVVTSNEFLKIEGLNELSLKAIKLLYIIISQCQMDDNEFYTIKINPMELQKLWGIKKQSIYKNLKPVSKELVKLFVSVDQDDEEEFDHIPLFARSTYKTDEETKEKCYLGKLNYESNSLFLGLKKNFSQPLLLDFNKMKTVNSILIWHLIQIKAVSKSKKPVGHKKIKSIVTVDEIRKITGTINKYKKMLDFRRRVIDQAIKEIYKNCNVKIEYTPIKEGKNIIAFEFRMINKYAIPKKQLSAKGERMLRRAKEFKLVN